MLQLLMEKYLLWHLTAAQLTSVYIFFYFIYLFIYLFPPSHFWIDGNRFNSKPPVLQLLMEKYLLWHLTPAPVTSVYILFILFICYYSHFRIGGNRFNFKPRKLMKKLKISLANLKSKLEKVPSNSKMNIAEYIN